MQIKFLSTTQCAILMFCILISGLALAYAPWIAYGDLRGYLEPCGCDPKTDLGGIGRIAQIVKIERLNYSDILVLDLGNAFLASKNSDYIEKNIVLQEGIKEIKPSGILFNVLEFEYYQAHPQAWLSAHNFKLPYVLSNQKKMSKITKFEIPEEISTTSAVIMGFLMPSKLEITKDFDQDIFNQWQKRLKQYGQKEKILLFSGDEKTLNKIIDAQLFNVIVRSNHKSFDFAPTKDEKENESLLIYVYKDSKYFSVPLAGQGVVRGGALRNSRPSVLSEILKTTIKPGSFENLAKKDALESLPKENYFTWLDPSFSEGAPLKDLLLRYYDGQKSLLGSQRGEKLAQLKDSLFVGSEKCQSCHADAYKKWKSTKHAHAFLSLKEKGKHEIAECIQCHSIGFNQSGGFINETDSPWLMNVGCENCHGPRKNHTLEPSKFKAAREYQEPKKICVNCHNPTHSPDFDKASYFPRIEHK